MDSIIKIGELAPQLDLQDLGGEHHTLVKYQNWIVVLNFWSAECDWCKRVDEELITFLAPWKDRVKVLWIASNDNESVDLIAKTAAERKLPTVLVDAGHKVADLYGAQTTPHFFVLDGNGRLKYQGSWDNITFRQKNATQLYIPMVIEALVNNRSPEVSSSPAYGCTLVRYPA